jgi:hypothetical protein
MKLKIIYWWNLVSCDIRYTTGEQVRAASEKIQDSQLANDFFINNLLKISAYNLARFNFWNQLDNYRSYTWGKNEN